MTWRTGTFVEWHIEIKRVWEDKEYDWQGTHNDSTDTRELKRIPDKNHNTGHSVFEGWGGGRIFYETEELAKEAVKRFLNGPEPHWHDNDFGWYYTDAHYEIRIRKVTLIVDEPIEIVGPAHPALLKRQPGNTRHGYAGYRRVIKE